MFYHPRMKNSPLVLTILLLLCVSANAQTVSPDDAKIKDGVYSNSFFNLSFAYPKDWVIPDEVIKEQLKEKANESATAQGKLAAMKDSYLLFTLSRQPLGTPSRTVNPSIMVAAEKISHVPGNPTAKDFLIGFRPIKQQMGFQSSLPEPVPFRVAGLQFFRDEYGGTIRGVNMNQITFAVFKKGYAVVFTFTGEDQKAVAEMAKLMNTIVPLSKGGPRP